jgi:ATP/maltotriose-dependent transcriptional regulator MalT
VDAAANALQSALVELEGNRLARARLLPALVEAALAKGDLAQARTAVAELEEIAETFGTAALGAAAAHARGALELAAGNAEEAAANLIAGQRLWLRVEAPYDAARAGELLAEAFLHRGDREGGLLELRAAGTAFERLGAALDVRRISERLEELGTA